MEPAYGIYIWSAYGATALVVAALLIRAVVDHRRQVLALATLEAAEPGANRG